MIIRVKNRESRIKLLLATACGLAIITALALLITISSKKQSSFNIKYGVSFSPTYAQELGLNWKEVYASTLNDLQVKNIRLPAYWMNLESSPGNFNFTDVDFMIEEASKSGVKVLLVVGAKQPRWPECQLPDWSRSLTLPERQKATLGIVEKVISRYKDNLAIWGWQVENEPLFQFGENCDPPNREFLSQEVELVRKLDPSRPVVITDTGEWRPWVTPMRLSDILGISLYRRAHNKYLGDYNYPFPAFTYTLKSNLVRKLFAPQNQKTIITELQGEPWSEKSLSQTPLEKQIKLFSGDNLKENVEFAKSTGFEEVYLWGIEWWYFMKNQGYPGYWEYAKDLFR